MKIHALAQMLDVEARLKPIPAFYCCYLLRSTIRHSSLYVGSSPNPARRLAQHNGKVQGGAARTSRLSLRPWEMVCIVAGFPSNIAALQFEWAWQNAHLTRHISSEDRISFPTTRLKSNPKTGKTKKRPGRPRTSLIDKLSNLQLLLRAPYFSSWPLELRFFNTDVYASWNAWCSRGEINLREGLKVVLDVQQNIEESEEFSSAQRSQKRRKVDLFGKGGVEGLDPTYARYQNVLEGITNISISGSSHICHLCQNKVDVACGLTVVCPESSCHAVTHLKCLSNHFLVKGSNTAIVPESGPCPSCKVQHKWMDLMRPLTLRLRAGKEVDKLLKKRSNSTAAIAAEILEEDDSDAEDEANDLPAQVMLNEDVQPDFRDAISVSSIDTSTSMDPDLDMWPSTNPPNRLEIVIEDSEDER